MTCNRQEETMMMTLRRIALLAAAAAISACASAGGGTESREARPVTTVVVDNQALLDMTVYVLRGGQRVRLGHATGVSRTRFTIPYGVVFGATTLRFLADPIGSGRMPVSEEITVREGDELMLRIPPA